MTTLGPAQAWGYLLLCRWRRRIVSLRKRPLALASFVLGLMVSAVAQFFLLRSTANTSLPPSVVDILVALLPYLLPATAFVAAFRTPLRLATADVSWLLSAPGGARLLLARYVFGFPALIAVVGGLGAVVSRWVMSLPVLPAWKVAVVLGATVLTIRLVALLAHLFSLKAATLARTLALAWAGGMVFSSAIDMGSTVRGEPVIRRWLLVVTQPEAVHASWVLAPAFLTAALALAVVGVARGFSEAAEERARQNAELQETMRNDTTGLETGSNWFRSGQRSWTGAPWLAGERALLFRGAVQQRRMLITSGSELTLELLTTLFLLVVAEHLAWIPLAIMLSVCVLTNSFTGIVIELDHHHVWVAPLRPWRMLCAATAVPALTVCFGAQTLWLTLAIGDVIQFRVWLAGVLLLPLAVVVVLLAGALATAVGGRGVLRVPLSTGFTLIGIAPLSLLALTSTWSALVLVSLVLVALSVVATALVSRQLWAPAGHSAGQEHDLLAE